MSSFLLRAQSGLSQGFSFFDAEIPAPNGDEMPALEREGALTVDAAERWLQMRSGQRFFLFVQVDGRDADAAVARLSAALKQRRLYDEATILVVGDHGEAGSGMSLDDTALRVPLIVKQPNGEGAGRRVTAPVQHIDLVPTILDLVRAPEPGGLRGRSLRPVLDEEDAAIESQPIYAESFAAVLPVWRHADSTTPDRRTLRYVRGLHEELVALTPPGRLRPAAASQPRPAVSISALNRMFCRPRQSHILRRSPAGDEERYALLGTLSVFPRTSSARQDPRLTVQNSTDRAYPRCGHAHRSEEILGRHSRTADHRQGAATARRGPLSAGRTAAAHGTSGRGDSSVRDCP